MNKTKICLGDKTILVTGSPGFIGASLVLRMIQDDRVMNSGTIISIDNMNDYYDCSLKEYRLGLIIEKIKKSRIKHIFEKGSISDKNFVEKIINTYHPDIVVNLAAQAGVRYSIENPDKYIESNIIGFYNILEACRHSYDNGNKGVEHLIYASSSSVYGSNKKTPFSIDDKVDEPVSLYAATKKTDELLAYCYSKLYNIPATGLRFFTVYGPAGRPDMFYYSATEKMVRGERIKLFNYGNQKRDFTYIDDIVEGILRVIQGAPIKKMGEDGLPIAPYALYNIGGEKPEILIDFISVLADELVRANVLQNSFNIYDYIDLVEMQPGDVDVTYADSSALERDFGFKPKIGIQEGLRRFSEWYKSYKYVDV